MFAQMASKVVGPRKVELAKLWGPSAARYGLALGALGLYLIEWKFVTEKIPFYGSKYEQEE